MQIESRTEECPECGEDIERDWELGLFQKGTRIPAPWMRDHQRDDTQSWKTACKPSKFATLCLCDAP